MKLSRSKIELYTECPRCFYLDVVKSVKRPAGFPFNINSAVDTLLKREFDRHREEGTSHPLQTKFGLNMVPANHPLIDHWRNNFKGVQFEDTLRSVLWYGAIDDIWVDSAGIYYVVDYKATAKSSPVTELADWTDGYKRQMEFYQWLLRKNNLAVSNTGYFVYCTGDNTRENFLDTIHFHSHIIAYTGSDSWIENRLNDLVFHLNSPNIPNAGANCSYCNYINNYNNNIIA